jgi:hypothetical protein
MPGAYSHPVNEKAHTTGEQQPGRKSHGISYWLCWLAAALALYGLSIGPANKLYEHYPAAGPALIAIYTPLRFLHEKCTPAARAMDWYLEMWNVRHYPSPAQAPRRPSPAS